MTLFIFLSNHPGKFFGMLKYQFQRFACWLSRPNNAMGFSSTAVFLAVVCGIIVRVAV